MPQQVRLINRSGKRVSAGMLVRIHSNPKYLNSFDIAKYGEVIVGVTASESSPGQGCNVNLMNTVRWEDILDKPSVSSGSPGLSAYQIAVSNGFQGSESEWITSLNGTNGVSGINDIGIVIDGGGSTITPGIKGYRSIPSGFIITGWTLIADAEGSCVIDIRKSTFDTFPTSSSIAASGKPTLNSARKGRSLTVGGWNTALSLGDIIEFNIESVSGISKLYLYIHLTHS